MVKVCVIGAGTAGFAAAQEAERSGASVTLLESSQTPPLPRNKWADLLGPSVRKDTPLSIGPQPKPLFGEQALSVDKGLTVRTNSGSGTFDSVVIATGKKSRPRELRGIGKNGVHLLISATSYFHLGRAAANYERVVVSGHAIDALRIGSDLSGRGTSVAVIVPKGDELERQVGDGAARALKRRAAEMEIEVVTGRPQRALGIERLEAIVVEGKILRCDGLALLPDLDPSFPSNSADLGQRGGILVDEHLGTSIPGLLAAGGCAEMAISSHWRTGSLERSADASGRAAGANAAGRATTFLPVGYVQLRLFGLDLVVAGLTEIEARFVGYDATETHYRQDDTTECTIVSEKRTGRVLGVQIVSPSGARGQAVPFAALQLMTMKSLAYSDFGGSTDISLVAEAARQGTSWR